MKSKEWIGVIAVVVVVAVIASLVTTNITGNFIKVKSVSSGTNVYTKTEIDTKINALHNLIIPEIYNRNNKTLDLLSNCVVVNVGVPAPYGIVQTGKYVCSNLGKKCISNFIGFNPNVTVSGNTNKISQPISCNDATNNYPTASWARTTCCAA